jgi:hypothetical protein
MGAFACSKRRPSIGVAALLAVALTTLSAPAVAIAASIPTLSVNGVQLHSSTRSGAAFTVTVNAPSGAKVKFKMDGVYLGQDSAAPYTWPIRTASGSHKLNARWDGGDADALFTVRPGAPATPPAPAVPTPEPAPVTPPAPAVPTPVTTIRVATAAQLSAALQAVRPGQTITVADGLYVGKFASASAGTATAPIVLTGSRKAILSTGSASSGYGLHLTGSHWQVRGISVTKSGKGIVLDGSRHTVISGVDVGNIGAEAVHFRTSSSDGVIQDSIIHDIGLTQPEYGEGIYVGTAKSNWKKVMGSASLMDRSDRVIIRNNRILNTTAEGVDVKEGTTGGSISGNVFTNSGWSGIHFGDSWVDLKGNGYRVTNNSGSGTKLDAFQVHVSVAGWGRDNVFSGNVVTGGVPGYEVWVPSDASGTKIACKTTGAARGLSNIPCSA